MSEVTIRSSLDRTTKVDTTFVKRQAWRDQHILIVNPDDPLLNLGWDERQLLRNIGDKLYGKGRSAGG